MRLGNYFLLDGHHKLLAYKIIFLFIYVTRYIRTRVFPAALIIYVGAVFVDKKTSA